MRTDSPPDGAGDAVAIKIEFRSAGSDDVAVDVHLHAVDHRMEVFAQKSIALQRRDEAVGETGGTAA